MAQTWKYAIGLGLLGSALATGCVVTTGGDPDVSDAGESGEGGSGGTTGGSSGMGGTGGSSGKGGTGGSSGKGGTGGSAGKGGAAGSSGATGGSAGKGGAAGSGGSAGTSGTGGMPDDDYIPQCDPATGNLDNTPYPNCEPSNTEDPTCEECIQESCCEESIACYSYDPGNVCGWGGPASGDYAGIGEIGCYVTCLADYVDENGVCDEDGVGECIGRCRTPTCGDVLGNQTSELATCIHDSCNEACLGIATCE
jgi:hypothetical protein